MSAAHQAHQARDSDWVDRIARAGLVAYGVVHVVIGWLAVQLALGDREGGASTNGAVKKLAEQPFGAVLVWLIAVGMLLLAAWQAVEAVAGHRQEEEDSTRVRKRLTSAGKVVVYVVIGVSAVSVAVGSGSSGGTDSLTGSLMDAPGGQVLVALVGAGVIAVGVAHLVSAWKESYLETVDGEGRSGQSGRAYRWLGRGGYTAKGVALGVVGVLFGYAAVTHDAKKSGGLDQALQKVLQQTGGPVLLAAIGLGFAAFGAFCFVQARYLDR